MRIKPIWMIRASGAILAISPSHAQTYDPNYPVCFQITEWGGTHIDCSFMSMPQCQATASPRVKTTRLTRSGHLS